MKVKVFSTPTCPYCNMAKDYLKENNVKFSDVNVAADAGAREEMVKKSGQMGVPVITITKGEGKTTKETVIVGFDREKIESVLGLNS